MNGKPDSQQEIERKVVGEENYVCWRIGGTFHFEAKLQSYPFDTQGLDIVLEHPS